MNDQIVIGVEDLAAGIAWDDVTVLDARFDLADPARGERDYRDGHIAGALYANLDRDLSDLAKQGEGRHPLPDQSRFSATLAEWGLAVERRIVVYDAANGALAAARLWWMLGLAGFTRVSVLDGGIGAWQAASGALESGLPVAQPDSEDRRAIDIRLNCHAIVWYDELEQRRHDPNSLVIDARASARYQGDIEPIDAKAGHVPGAVNRPFGENLDRSGRFKPADILRHEFAELLEGREPRDVVHMCGSGVTACHNALAMAHAGLAGSRVFAPSWSGWISDPKRPVAIGPA